MAYCTPSGPAPFCRKCTASGHLQMVWCSRPQPRTCSSSRISTPRARHTCVVPCRPLGAQPVARCLRRRPVRCMSSSGPDDSEQDNPTSSKWLQRLWTTVDVGASLGSVAGAVAFILTQEAMLVGLPVVLPLLALYASRQREKGVLKAAVRAATKEAQATTSAVIATTVQDALLEMKAELQQAQSQQLQRQPQGSQLRSIEAKLAAMEGSVLSAGRSAQEAARQVDASGAKLARTTAAQLDSVLAALRREVRAELQTSSSDPASALARLEGRLASLEGSLNGMEMSQVEGMRRLTNSLTSAIADAEEALQATVRAETMRALEPVRRLPQMLATALPVTDITALQPIADGALPVMASLTPEERRALRELVAEETRKGSQRVVDAQVQALKRASAQPVLLADEQWAALGKRLASIERNMQHLSASQEEASSSSQGDMERLAEQLRGAKRDIVAVLEGLVPDGQLSEAVLDGLAGVQQSLQRLQAQVTATEQAIESSPARIDERGDLSRVLEPLQQSLEGIRASQAVLQQAQQAQQAGEGAASLAAVNGEALQRSVGATLSAVQALEQQMLQRIDRLGDILAALPVGSFPEDAGPPDSRAEASADGNAGSGSTAAQKGVPADGDAMATTAASSRRQDDAHADRDQAAGPPSSSQEAADEDSKEAAFKRMQALLAARNDLPSPQASPSQASDAFDRRSTNAQASTSGSTSSPTNQPNSNSQVPIDSWLDGPRRYEPHPLLDDQLHFSDPGGPRNATGRPAGPDVPGQLGDARNPMSGFSESGRQPSSRSPAGYAVNGDAMAAASLQPPLSSGAAFSTEPDGSEIAAEPPAGAAGDAWDAAGYADQAAERQSDTPRWPGGSEYDGSSGGVDAYGRPILERPATPEPSASPPGYASTSPDADSSSNGTGQSASNGRDPWSSSQANSSGPGTSYDSDGRPPYYSGSERLSDRGNEIEQPGAYGDGQPMYYGDQPPADDRLYAAGQPDPRSDPYQSDGSQPCYMGEPTNAAYQTASPAREGAAAASSASQAASNGAEGPGGVAVLVREGLQLLREGREAARAGQNLGEADALLREAVACFQEAAALKPASVKVLGNWGNALLAAGSNKKQFVDVLRSGPLPVAGEEEALGLADLRLVQEAEELLIQAGRRFLAVLQQQPDDPKALSNWAKALCVRAALATDPQTAAALYESAIAKFEACLEIDPDNVTALCACGFALRDLAQTQSKPRRVRELLEDARSYLQAAADRGPIDDTSIEQAIRQCDEDLEDLRAGASGR